MGFRLSALWPFCQVVISFNITRRILIARTINLLSIFFYYSSIDFIESEFYFKPWLTKNINIYKIQNKNELSWVSSTKIWTFRPKKKTWLIQSLTTHVEFIKQDNPFIKIGFLLEITMAEDPLCISQFWNLLDTCVQTEHHNF